MSFIQNMAIPKELERLFNINDFDGGLNNVKSSFELSDNESPEHLNVIMFEPGSIETRPGIIKYITEQLPEVVQKIYVYDIDEGQHFIISSKTKLYSVPTIGGAITELCALNNVASGVQVENLFFFVDGDKYRVYDGTNVFEIIDPDVFIGVAQAGTGTTITLPVDASSDDDYYNGYTIYISAGTGSGQKRVITDYDGTTKIATVENWNTSPDNTSTIFITSTAQGVVTTDDDAFTKCYSPTYLEFNDTFKGLNNISMVAKCTHMRLHKTRLWFACDSEHPNIVYSTDIDNMFYVPVNNYYPPITNDSDDINGLFSFNGVLIIWKKRTIYALFGDDYTDYDLKEVTTDCGTINIETVCKVGNYLYYLGSDGVVYSLNDVRTDYKKLLTAPISTSIELVKHPISIYPGDWLDSRAIYHGGFYFLAIKDKVLTFSYGKGWHLWNNLNPTAFVTYDNALILANDKKYLYRLPLTRFYVEETFIAEAGQTIFELQKGCIGSVVNDFEVSVNSVAVDIKNVGQQNYHAITLPECVGGEAVKAKYLSILPYSDDGDAYDSYYYTHDMYFGYPSRTKQLKNIYINIIAVDYWIVDLKVSAYIDYFDVDGGITIKNGITVFGVAKFGDRFQDKNVVVPYQVPINRRGKIVKFKISTSGANQPFKIFTINGTIVIRNK